MACALDKCRYYVYNESMIRNNTTKRNEMESNYKKIVKYLMAKGYSKLEAKRLAKQAAKQLELSRLAMIEAVISRG